jgi:hypothetical protein
MRGLGAATLFMAIKSASAASFPAAYDIEQLGLIDGEHTRPDGYQFSAAQFLTDTGDVVGRSKRFTGIGTEFGESAWVYSAGVTNRAGIVNAETTSQNGERFSLATEFNQSGQVVGYSNRYSGLNSNGVAAWFYSSGTSRRLGYFDSLHTALSTGFQRSEAQFLNASGQVAGYSDRYAGSSQGSTAWMYLTGNTTRLGFFDPVHTRASDGIQVSSIASQNNAGQVIGLSQRYFPTGSNANGSSAWIYSGGSMIRLGYIDSLHTGSVGAQVSIASFLNQNGVVAGASIRYPSGVERGQSLWLWSQGITTRVGFFDADHTHPTTGQQAGELRLLNDAGQAVGVSSRYNSSGSLSGNDAWIYSNGVNTRIGLYDAEHTSPFNTQGSDPRLLNQGGDVVGYANQFASGGIGQSAWIYTAGTTARIGLIDAEHTSPNGLRNSWVRLLNETGQAAGYSWRDGDVIPAGQSSWVYAKGVTHNVGLIDGLHVAPSGYRYSDVQFLNDAGQAAGFSHQYAGAETGQSGWFFDSDTLTTYPLIFSTRSDGIAFTDVEYLSNSGIVLGQYRLFDPSDSYMSRVFAWTMTEGLRDLGELVDGGLSSRGWSDLLHATDINSLDQIIGFGQRNGVPSGMAYLLTPVPEPIGSALVGSLALLLSRRCGPRRPR